MSGNIPLIPGSGGSSRSSPRGLRGGTGIAIAGLVTLAVCGAALFWFVRGGGSHGSLREATLTGARQTKGAVCLDVAGDFSGSMRENVDTRDEALALLKPFMIREMAPGDILTSAKFAQTASLALPPTRAADLARATEAHAHFTEGDHTYLAPAVRELDRAHKQAGTECEQRVLVAITDGRFSDDSSRLAELLSPFDRVYLAVPDEDSDYRPPFVHDGRLRFVVSNGFGDADELSLLYGKALATATGQQLTRQ
ncbi:hypothetical protein [Nonomuraea lactucae]|uniref:hypothetical protein n=1 Tax=Nonomuraea lactucae TaxID=2249762 RepID=UPI000DE35A20|nr:hypothetical protein [Nonomuraea lactucae]